MKKSIIAIAALAVFTVTNSFSQAYKSNGHDGPVYVTSSRTTTNVTDMELRELDRIVSLTRNQEKEIAKIKDYYARVSKNAKKSQTWASVNRLDEQERHDILEVLSSAQLKKLNSYQYAVKDNSKNRVNVRNRPNSRG
ncbi:hypothetical protein DSL64_22420 [Dyadobacter luteus]|jgi:uncharacterized Ntn-hydrolase superfamily protein|uniref:Uncharacterized protein n=1 Tax=Dyadobacter luteus TaxID=2259619 RepID=A0A3D8Y6Z5_9BACT|nr:hypothetical protein [Dyadobacter luteus]REA57881.1 hypothetical protein DSL64_22420 [Dyadobacter luteus]